MYTQVDVTSELGLYRVTKGVSSAQQEACEALDISQNSVIWYSASNEENTLSFLVLRITSLLPKPKKNSYNSHGP